MQPGDYVRILGSGQFDDPVLTGQVGRIVVGFRDLWVVETRPRAYYGNAPDYWDNFTPEALAPADEDAMADYLVQQISE